MKPSSLAATPFTLTTASVAVAILPHLARLPWSFAVPIALLVLARWLQRRWRAVPIPAVLRLPLVLLFPALIVLHYGNLFGRGPGSVLACAMLALKLAETETPRDARAAVAFSCFVLMSALLFEGGLGFTLLLLAGLSLPLATLRELEIADTARPLRIALRENLLHGASTLLAATPLCLLVFLFFPRLGSPLWGTPTDLATARTGLGDRMTPGALQELLTDDTPAFRVSFAAAAPPRSELYWRGPVLWFFDGSTWSRPEFFGSAPNEDRSELQAIGPTVEYEVTLEPNDRRWLLALDMPLATPDDTVRGADMSLVHRTPVDRLLRYRLRSAPRYRLGSKLDPLHRRFALQLPEGFDPRARELAAQWRRELGDEVAIIRAALNLFHDHFVYSLNAPLLGRDSVDDFLFETRRGFCEHFASAFTFLMRAAGIPARVVTGYQGGSYNGVGQYWVVRQSDAHAWAEVWLTGRGWVRVDPTAAVSPQRVEFGARAAAGEGARWYQAGWLQDLRNRLDFVNRFWNDAILQFDAIRQQNLLVPLGIDRAESRELIVALALLSGLLLSIALGWVLRTPHSSTDPLDAAYARLCAKLARAGVIRDPAEGPYHLAARLATRWPERRDLQRLLAAYVRLRYAHISPRPSAVRVFARTVALLRLQRPGA
jgi:transglutaminase-like putative cysteine protease